MKEFQMIYTTENDLLEFLNGIKTSNSTLKSESLLFNITWTTEAKINLDIVVSTIASVFPDSEYYGNSASGNIFNGDFSFGIHISCYLFELSDSKTELIWVEKNTEISSLDELWSYCRQKDCIRAIEMIPSMVYLDELRMDNNIPDIDKDIVIFGGASAEYDTSVYAAEVFAKGHSSTSEGMAVILYLGENFHFASYSVLGWKGLGKYMEVTSCNEKNIFEIDNSPAYSVYENYLNLSLEDNDTLVFPLIVEEDGIEFIRTPQNIYPDRSMQMFANIPVGTKVRIAYGDKNTILDDIFEKAKIINDSMPEAIKIFSCAGRRMFWGDNQVGKETQILEQIAPVNGFYTGGEILRFGDRLRVLNQTLAIVTISETVNTESRKKVDLKTKSTDKSLVSRLAYFTQKVSEEKEDAYKIVEADKALMLENMQMIRGLAEEYLALFYVNMDEGFYKIYSFDKTRLANVRSVLTGVEQGPSIIQKFGNSDYIHPDDRCLFDEIDNDFIRERLSRSKRFSIRFRQKFDDEYLWVEMDVIKYEDIDQRANEIAIGFSERDAEIKGEQVNTNCFNVLCKEISSDAAIDEVLSIAGEFYDADRCCIFEFSENRILINNTYEWCKHTCLSVMPFLQNIPASDFRKWFDVFRDQGYLSMEVRHNNINYPESNAKLEMLGVENILAVPILNGDEFVGYIGIDNPKKAKNNPSVLKNVAVVAYSEILKSKENNEEHVTLQKLTDTFLSVFFVDLSRDYIHNWKIDSDYSDAYGKVRHYSIDMGGYVRNNIAERDRERCIELTSPKGVLEQFRKSDRFSIDMTDIMLGFERDIVFDYIKVNSEGTKFVMCSRDVTENLKREREHALNMDLANQQRHIKKFGDMVNAALWSMNVDDDNNIVDVFWSPEFRHIFGFNDESDFPNNVEFLYSRIFQDDKESTLNYFFNSITSRNTDEFVFDRKFRMVKKDDDICWYHVVGRMELNENGTRKLYGIVTDISAEKRLEEQLALSDGLAREFHTVWLVEGYDEHRLHLFRSTGKTTIHDAVQKGIDEPYYDSTMLKYVMKYVHEDDRNRVLEASKFRNIVKETPDTGTYVISYKRYINDNHDFDYHQMCFAKAVAEDGTVNYILAFRDADKILRDQLAQQQRLEKALIDADAANKSKTSFLFNMSHDIRTPMNAIIGFTNMAVKYIDDKEKTLDCLNKTQQSGNMLLSLINSVLEVSRIESGQAVLEEQNGDVYYSFTNLDSTLQELAKVKNIDLTFEFNNIKDRYVLCDFSRCIRIFVNVISNAIKYTHDGGYVKVSCEQITDVIDGYAKYRYTISDNGIGMSEEFQKHVFEHFSRENTATVSGIQGTGLGMAVCKSFVELMGGTIECESKQNVGTTFRIVLPFKVQKEAVYTDPVTGSLVSNEVVSPINENVDFTGMTVLLVEDNEMNREIATEILEDKGLIVDDADDGTVAVRKVKENGPDYYDFILMDIQMPVMGGYEASRIIREMYPDNHIPIVALSANAFVEDKLCSLEAGMDDHVAKPINIKELFRVLSKYIKK